MNKLFKTLLSAATAVALASGLTACNDSDTGGTYSDMNIFTPQVSTSGVELRFDRTSSVIPTNGDQLLSQVPYLFSGNKPLRALVSYTFEVNADEPNPDKTTRLVAQVNGIDSICTTNAIVRYIENELDYDNQSDPFNINTQRYTFISDGYLNIHYEIASDGYWNDSKNGSPDFKLIADASKPGNFYLIYNAGEHKGSSTFSYLASFYLRYIPEIQEAKTITVHYGNGRVLTFELGDKGIYDAIAPKSSSNS